MRNKRLVEMQRDTIEQLEKENKFLEKENELLKKNNQRLEDETSEIKKSFEAAFEQYKNMMSEMKSLSDDAQLAIKSAALNNKEIKTEFTSLVKDINKSKKKIPILCSSCGEKLTNDYVFKNGCYICVHCWDSGVI